MIPKNSFVRIKKIVLQKEQRASNIPIDTANTPLVMKTKGFLLSDSDIGEVVTIKTVTGRIEEGILLEANHNYTHNFGEYVEELATLRQRIVGELDE